MAQEATLKTLTKPSASVWAALLGQTLISAFTYLAAKRSMRELDAVNLLLLRVFLSSGLFAIILMLTPGRKLPPKEMLWPLLGLGFLAGPINQGFFLYGLSSSSAAHAALLYALTPLGVLGMSLALGREKGTWKRLGGMFLAFLGVVVLLLGRGLQAAREPLVGDLFILAAVGAWVVYTTEGKRWAMEVGPVRSTAWTMISASLWLIPVALWKFDSATVLALSVMAKASVAFLVIMTSVVSYVLWYYALARMEASKVAIFANLQPVATAFLAWWILGEPWTWEITAGGALVLLGVALTQR